MLKINYQNKKDSHINESSQHITGSKGQLLQALHHPDIGILSKITDSELMKLKHSIR